MRVKKNPLSKRPLKNARQTEHISDAWKQSGRGARPSFRHPRLDPGCLGHHRLLPPHRSARVRNARKRLGGLTRRSRSRRMAVRTLDRPRPYPGRPVQCPSGALDARPRRQALQPRHHGQIEHLIAVSKPPKIAITAIMRNSSCSQTHSSETSENESKHFPDHNGYSSVSRYGAEPIDNAMLRHVAVRNGNG